MLQEGRRGGGVDGGMGGPGGSEQHHGLGLRPPVRYQTVDQPWRPAAGVQGAPVRLSAMASQLAAPLLLSSTTSDNLGPRPRLPQKGRRARIASPANRRYRRLRRAQPREQTARVLHTSDRAASNVRRMAHTQKKKNLAAVANIKLNPEETAGAVNSRCLCTLTACPSPSSPFLWKKPTSAIHFLSGGTEWRVTWVSLRQLVALKLKSRCWFIWVIYSYP